MKKLFLFAVASILTIGFSFGQGTVRGKVTDENGETLIGVTIVLKSNKSYGTITDFDGNYSLKIPDATPQTLVISFISYKTIEENVNPKNGEVIVKDVTLSTSAKEIKEVVVTAKAVKAKEYYTETIKKNSATTLDYISSETMKKTGDFNVTAAVARVTGVSTTSNGFITVRGIGDRYVKTAINGSRIPTLDPFTNNIKLDMFPASLVDNVMITKTASPEMPGDWAGAYISIETKDYPEALTVNAESSFGYNEQSTFKNVLSSERSSTDWLGYDNNFRSYNHADFVTTNITPTHYDEFVALGLGPFYNAIGVNERNWLDESTPSGATYFKLGLVELGLLAPALMNDQDAYIAASNLYLKGDYSSRAFQIINANVPASGKSFANNWNTVERQAPINFSQSFSVGNQTKLFGKPLGYLFGFRYGSGTVYDPNSSAQRLRFDGSLESSEDQQSSIETNAWSGLVNLAYKFSPNNSVSLLFMPNFNGTNKVKKSYEYSDYPNVKISSNQFYEQRKQMVYQYKSEHYLPGPKMKIEANASYTNGSSTAPDFKSLSFKRDSASFTNYQIGPTVEQGVHRYYRYLTEDLFDSRLSVEIPIANSAKAGTRKVKFGGAYQYNDRQSDQYDYALFYGPNFIPGIDNDDLNSLFDLSNFEISSGVSNGNPYSTINQYYIESGNAANHTFGTSKIAAAFAMVDYAIVPRLRFSGGLRMEHAKIYTDVNQFDSLGIPVDDIRRDYRTGYPSANPGELNEVSYLPSANFIYKIKNDDAAPVNLRLNFSQTVARPSIRELSDVAVFDYEYRGEVFGNSDLQMVQVNNYDFRIESYFKSGDNISASLFYKTFKNQIELVNYGNFTWQNVDDSNVKGIELEGKKKLTRHFDFGANITLVYSETNYVRSRLEIGGAGTKVYIPVDTISRAMFGQAPYVLNGLFTYRADSLGLSVTVSYNVQGERLAIASVVKEIPDVYELPRHLVDVKISKSLGKHFGVSLKIRDLLNTPIVRSYKGTDVEYDRYTYGTNYIFEINYKL